MPVIDDADAVSGVQWIGVAEPRALDAGASDFAPGRKRDGGQESHDGALRARTGPRSRWPTGQASRQRSARGRTPCAVAFRCAYSGRNAHP